MGGKNFFLCINKIKNYKLFKTNKIHTRNTKLIKVLQF